MGQLGNQCDQRLVYRFLGVGDGENGHLDCWAGLAGRPSWVLPACWQPPLYAVGWTGDGSWSASLWESWASLVVHRVCLGAVSAFGETGFLCGLAFLGEIGIGGNRCQFHPGPEPLASVALGDGVASPELLHLDLHVTDH